MGRERVYFDNAQRQAAYRARRKAYDMKAAKNIAIVEQLHITIQKAAKAGSPVAAQLVADTPEVTAERLCAYLEGQGTLSELWQEMRPAQPANVTKSGQKPNKKPATNARGRSVRVL